MDIDRPRSILSFIIQLLLAALSVHGKSMESGENNHLRRFLDYLQDGHKFETILMQGCHSNEKIDNSLLEHLEVRVPVYLTRPEEKLRWLQFHNRNILAIVCLQPITSNYSVDSIKALSAKLNFMREAKTLIIDNLKMEQNEEPVYRSKIRRFLNKFIEHKMLNTILISKDFSSKPLTYAFVDMEGLQLIEHEFRNAERYEYFADKLANVNGHVLYTLPDQNEPRSFIVKDKEGREHLLGYLSKLVFAYAQKINATLQYPFALRIGHTLHLGELDALTRNGTIDLGTGVASPLLGTDLRHYTIPVEAITWFVMVPVEEDMKFSEMFQMLLRSDLILYSMILAFCLSILLTIGEYQRKAKRIDFWLDMLLNDKSFRGALALAFPVKSRNTLSVGVTLTLIFITGLVISTTFCAYLQSFLTQPQLQKPLRSFEDFQGSTVKIIISEYEVNVTNIVVGPEFFRRFQNIYHVLPTFEEFSIWRRHLDNRYAWPITTPLWKVFDQLQSGFQRKLFRFDARFILSGTAFYCVPINENSIYEHSLNEFLLQVEMAGLKNYWERMAFLEMRRSGRVPVIDRTVKYHTQSLSSEDFYWIFMGYCTFVAMSFIVFLGEILFYFIYAKVSKMTCFSMSK